MKDDWSFTIENCDVNDDALNELAGLKNNKFDAKSVTFRKINDATTATKATSPSEVTVKVNCDTTDAITQLQDLYTMLDQLNEQVMRVKKNMGSMESADIFTNNYNNCTFLYGKYGRANVVKLMKTKMQTLKITNAIVTVIAIAVISKKGNYYV